MPSQIKVDQITDSSGTIAPEFPNGVVATELVSNTWKNSDGTENYKCKAWVNFDGTTTPPTIRASGNVSSVTKSSTGIYTVNFITPMVDVDYATSMSISVNSTTVSLVIAEGAGRTTSSYVMYAKRVHTDAYNDGNRVNLIVFR